MIKLGRTSYWLTGDRFFFGDREKQRDLTADDREPLLRYLCTCAFGLNRWQGEANEHGERFSVGEHSLLVAALAGRIATLRGLDTADVALAVRLGAVHDLGETLGLGDIAAPWLRSSHGIDLRGWCLLHQAQVEALAGISTTPLGASRLVKDADHLAAAVERRAFFLDLTGDMEHPDVPRLMVEVFGDVDVEGNGDELCNLVYPSDADTLLALVLGDTSDPIFVLGEHLMIKDGKVVGP